jgi:thymidylate synthase
MFWRGVVEELLWFISGSTNTQDLAKHGVHIWDKFGTTQYHADMLNQRLRDRGNTTDTIRAGEVGPMYGWQWRHWGATKNLDTEDDKGCGIDQLEKCIYLIKENPTSRRIVMSTWNVGQLKSMKLAPCHILAQFYVHNDKTLSCHVYQRSADMAVGYPFNIASYALLTHMISHVCGMTARELVYSIGDAHVYENHVEVLQQTQLQRHVLNGFPRIEFTRQVPDIDSFTIDDITLVDYVSQPAIQLELNV